MNMPFFFFFPRCFLLILVLILPAVSHFWDVALCYLTAWLCFTLLHPGAAAGLVGSSTGLW